MPSWAWRFVTPHQAAAKPAENGAGAPGVTTQRNPSRSRKPCQSDSSPLVDIGEIRAEIDRVQEAGFVREAQLPDRELWTGGFRPSGYPGPNGWERQPLTTPALRAVEVVVEDVGARLGAPESRRGPIVTVEDTREGLADTDALRRSESARETRCALVVDFDPS